MKVVDAGFVPVGVVARLAAVVGAAGLWARFADILALVVDERPVEQVTADLVRVLGPVRPDSVSTAVLTLYEQYHGHTARPSTTLGLSTTQLTVLQLMALGQSNEAIGNRLGITEHTVKNHNRRIFGKLKARDRTHAVAIAYEYGILGGGPGRAFSATFRTPAGRRHRRP